MYSKPDATNEEVLAVIDKINTWFHFPVTEISDSDDLQEELKYKCAVGQILLLKPKLLIIDEVTGGGSPKQ